MFPKVRRAFINLYKDNRTRETPDPASSFLYKGDITNERVIVMPLIMTQKLFLSCHDWSFYITIYLVKT